jgi:hypothetical protein
MDHQSHLGKKLTRKKFELSNYQFNINYNFLFFRILWTIDFSKIEKPGIASIMCVVFRKLFILITILIYLENIFVSTAIDKGKVSV